jgi:hypothetical protein
MKSKIVNWFIFIFFLFWTAAAIYFGHEYFPKTIQLPPEIIKPTEHELNELARQIAEPEIKKAKDYWESLPPVVITIQGEDSTYSETVELYPACSTDITKTFDWNFVFPNEDRPPDTLSFSTDNKILVTAYKDTSGASYIGYTDFTQEININNFSLLINPKVYQKESIDRYSVFLGLGGQISSAERLLNETIYKDYNLIIGAKIGILLKEQWYFGIESNFCQQFKSIGIVISKKIWRIRGR